MKPSLWPEWLNHDGLDLWAKSSSSAETGVPGESLAHHTWLVLARLSELAQLRPQLTTYLNTPRLWHCLFWACFLHDFGKAATGFQTMLRHPDQKWHRRHEVLSLAFLDWIAPAFSVEEQQWMLAAIVSHHRDAQAILKEYGSHFDLIEGMVAELDEQTVHGLWRWLSECSPTWIEWCGLSSYGVQPVSFVKEEQAVQMICHTGPSLINRWLQTYADCLDEWQRSRSAFRVPALVMLRGLTTTADHAASAHLDGIPQGITTSWETLDAQMKLVFGKHQQVMGTDGSIVTHAHQRDCAVHHQTSALLIAPTGSGKTEAALFWALGDGVSPAPRIFYALPYQASMNAMHQRLSQPPYFRENVVGLQHGRALQTLYARLLDAETGSSSVAEDTRWRLNLNKLHAYPIKIFSPYQMLKVLYQLKGFEGMLTDYTQAAFIFDEIHAYDPHRLALILALIKYLREQYDARFLLMSATFPSLLRDMLPDILGTDITIRAESVLFHAFCRHRLAVMDGDLLVQGVAHILADVRQGKSVLVCCNTVQRAQDMRAILLQYLQPDQLELLHSRFHMRDRLAHENAVLRRCANGTPSQAIVVVATQVVEVSLNIDLDTIYTDPAPLDALIQRFGRVNCSRSKGIVPVHVFREPQDGQGIYQAYLVERTLTVLEQHNGKDIDEAEIGDWLDEIYQEPEIRNPWLKAYQQQFQLAEQLLHSLRPFASDKDREKQFEELFDGVEVLPIRFEAQYLEHIRKSEFIEASQLFVPISSKSVTISKSEEKFVP